MKAVLSRVFNGKHMFKESEYRKFGIGLIHHILRADEFILASGKGLERDANELIRKLAPEVYSRKVREELKGVFQDLAVL